MISSHVTQAGLYMHFL